MPDKDNPAKQIPIAPRFFLSSSKSKPEPALPEALAVPERRALAASYVTGQDNPWFAKAYINRIWYALMGEAFYEPIDDIGPERTPKAVEVLDPLAEQWQKGGYDIRWLFRTILNTEAYQRRVRSTANAAGKTPFASSCPSRLRADQVFDALVQALALPLDANGNLSPEPERRQARPRAGEECPESPGELESGRSQAAAGPSSDQGRGQESRRRPSGWPRRSARSRAPSMRPGGPRLLFDRLFGSIPRSPTKTSWGRFPRPCS